MTGRPSDYTDEIATRALELIAQGNTITRTAATLGLPTMTLWTWINEGRGLFVDSPRARDAGYDAVADQCFDIADDRDDDPQSRRIRIDTRLRLLGKWSKRYAEKQQHEHSGPEGKPIQHDVNVTADEAYRRLAD